jgi:NADH-quinone oxidoreductase subunit N
VPDVYSGVNMFITTYFATYVKFGLFIVFLHISYYLVAAPIIDFTIISSMLVGCYMTLRQTEIKRFLAYSSIFHIAFLLMGDISSSLVYALTYVISSLLFFSVLLTVRLNGKELIYLNDLKHLRQVSYRGTILLIVALSSFAGLPPFAGFYGKFMVWASLFEDIYLFNNAITYYILLTSVILSLVSVFYYMRLISYLFTQTDAQVPVVINVRGSFSIFGTQICSLLLLVF